MGQSKRIKSKKPAQLKRVNCRVISGKELIAARRKVVFMYNPKKEAQIKKMYSKDPQWMKDIMGAFE